MSPVLQSWMSQPSSKCVVIKAIAEDREIAGWACWAFRDFDGRKSVSPEGKKEGTTNVEQNHKKELEAIQSSKVLAPIQRLNTMTDASMSYWQARLSCSYSSPEPAHMILVAISILPPYQSQGAGSLLISYGTDIADARKVHCWVSSSDSGYRVFQKGGFEEVGRLELDLDLFAEAGCKNQAREDGKWGEYCWRYMRREARSKKQV
jgi:L-amino acid N-acyltransferase YncA